LTAGAAVALKPAAIIFTISSHHLSPLSSTLKGDALKSYVVSVNSPF
jgi:hypothetical protein